MKAIKTILIYTAFLPFFMSCVKDNMDAGIDGHTIRFGIGAETRGVAVSGNALVTGEEFGIYSYYLPGTTGTPGDDTNAVLNSDCFSNTKGTILANKDVDYGTWKYWPESKYDRLKFLSYYPYNAAGLTTSVSNAANDPYLQLNYQVPADAVSHQDIMFSAATPDYLAPVNIDFYHALSRLTFQARKSDELEDSDVEVTGIEIFNAPNTGTLKVRSTESSAMPEWSITELSGSEDILSYHFTYTTDISATGLSAECDNILMAAKESGKPSNDSFLVLPFDLPQEETDPAPCLKIKGTIDGEEFVYEFLVKDIISGGWKMGKHYNHRLTIEPGNLKISLLVEDWNDMTIGVSDGVYFLNISQKEFIFSDAKRTISSSDNKLTINTDYPQGWKAEVWNDLDGEVAVTDSWLSVSQDKGDDGDEISILAEENTDPNPRTAYVHISAGFLKLKVEVVQQAGSLELDFARSNIVYKNGVLTFAEDEEDNDVNGSGKRIPANSQGVFFQFGSMIAMSANENSYYLNNPNFYLVLPEEYKKKYGAKEPATWFDFPIYKKLNETNEDVFITDFPGGYDPEEAIGDICRYISDKGWVKDRWRMPTRQDFTDLYQKTPKGFTEAKEINSSGPLAGGMSTDPDNWTSQTHIPQAGSDFGTATMDNGWWFGPAVSSEIDPDEDDYKQSPIPGTVFFPASGGRNPNSGSMSFSGIAAYLWTNFPNNAVTEKDETNAVFWSTTSRLVVMLTGQLRTYGMPIRCIRDKDPKPYIAPSGFIRDGYAGHRVEARVRSNTNWSVSVDNPAVWGGYTADPDGTFTYWLKDDAPYGESVTLTFTAAGVASVTVTITVSRVRAEENIISISDDGRLNLDGEGQIVHFKARSLIAIYGGGVPWFQKKDIAWYPENYKIDELIEAIEAAGSVEDVWNLIPFYSYDGGTWPTLVFSEEEGIGDPCYYAKKNGMPDNSYRYASSMADFGGSIDDPNIEWTERRGMKGYLAADGQFYPCTGRYWNNGRFESGNSIAYYWRGTGWNEHANFVGFTNEKGLYNDMLTPNQGNVVRCVRNE